jgi:hypothetical protein
MYQTIPQARSDLQRAHDILIDAASKISEIEHPNQWMQLQDQIASCLALQLRMQNDS